MLTGGAFLFNPDFQSLQECFLLEVGGLLGPLLYLQSANLYPVSLALRLFESFSCDDWGAMFAMSVASLIPVFVLFVIFQNI